MPNDRLLPFVLAATAALLPAQNTGLQLTNGFDAYIDVPPDPTLVPRSGLTIEAWVTYDESTLGPGWRWPTVLRQNPTPQSEAYFLRVAAGNTNSLVVAFKVVTTNGSATATWPFSSGQLLAWTHLAGTYDGSNVRLFVNAQEVASVPLSGAIVNNNDVLRIGNGDLSAPGIEEWNGEIDEVRLWPFARTAAEIAATMNMELSSVPGEVSTWNLANHMFDSSGNNHGNGINSPTFAPNSLVLVPVASGAATVGAPTAGCNGLPRGVVTTPARVGNSAFAVGAIRSTSTGSGMLWIATRTVGAPIPFLGVGIWMDPSAPGVQIAVPGGPLGYARVPLAIPNNPFLASQQLAFQSLWVEPGCSTTLFATEAVRFTIAP